MLLRKISRFTGRLKPALLLTQRTRRFIIRRGVESWILGNDFGDSRFVRIKNHDAEICFVLRCGFGDDRKIISKLLGVVASDEQAEDIIDFTRIDLFELPKEPCSLHFRTIAQKTKERLQEVDRIIAWLDY